MTDLAIIAVCFVGTLGSLSLLHWAFESSARILRRRKNRGVRPIIED